MMHGQTKIKFTEDCIA